MKKRRTLSVGIEFESNKVSILKNEEK